MIPKVIHYCWFGGKNIPAEVKKCIRSWEKYCPNYKIIRWDETNIDVNCHPFMKAAYEAKAWAFVSDYARLKIVYENGGIYLDTDVELLKSLDVLLENKCFLGIQQSEKLCATGLGFGAVKASSVIFRLLQIYDEVRYSSDKQIEIACPYLNTKVLREVNYHYTDEIWKNEEMTVYPCRYFDPLAPGDSKNLMCNDTISIHHYSMTWLSKKKQIKRRLICFLGEQRIDKIKNILRRYGF